MPKGTLHFDLNEADDVDKLRRHIHVDEAFSTLWDVDQECRKKIKYDDTLPQETIALLEELRDMINGTGLLEYYQ